jgi:predicted MFS family arabinose efflux permease
MVFVLGFLLGCVNAVDNPTRQTFVSEMVRPEHLTNAVTLNSVVMNGARIVGPSIAGVTIYLVGVGPCFLLNGVSYAGVIYALWRMRPDDLIREAARPRSSRDLRAGLSYVREHPELRTTLLVVALVGTLTYEFNVTLPLFAEFTFDAGSGGLATMLSAMGAGAVVGGLAGASRSTPTPRRLAGVSLVFGATLAVLAAAPTLAVALLVLPFVGACSINFIAMANSMLQLRAEPHMRGRVMALYGVAFIGSTPVGGPIVGWVGEHHGARMSILLGAIAAVLASAAMWSLLRHDERRAAARADQAHATGAAG